MFANIGTVIDQARAENVPVIWVQHADDEMREGTDAWQYVPELTRDESEPLIHKLYPDSFERDASVVTTANVELTTPTEAGAG